MATEYLGASGKHDGRHGIVRKRQVKFVATSNGLFSIVVEHAEQDNVYDSIDTNFHMRCIDDDDYILCCDSLRKPLLNKSKIQNAQVSIYESDPRVKKGSITIMEGAFSLRACKAETKAISKPSPPPRKIPEPKLVQATSALPKSKQGKWFTRAVKKIGRLVGKLWMWLKREQKPAPLMDVGNVVSGATPALLLPRSSSVEMQSTLCVEDTLFAKFKAASDEYEAASLYDADDDEEDDDEEDVSQHSPLSSPSSLSI